MFQGSNFNNNISNWNVLNVKMMSYMFQKSKFNGDISKWDVSKILYMSFMFAGSSFSQDLSDWKPYYVEDMENMFLNCKAIIPYWSDYKSFKDRKNTIDAYWIKKNLKNELSDNLIINQFIDKKLKI
jgi:hypothetical protein